MPYITRDQRDEVAKRGALSVGELTYAVTREVLQYLGTQDAINGQLRYEHYGVAVAALECAKLELYRRLVAPHEDKAIERNGDIYFTPSGVSNG